MNVTTDIIDGDDEDAIGQPGEHILKHFEAQDESNTPQGNVSHEKEIGSAEGGRA